MSRFIAIGMILMLAFVISVPANLDLVLAVLSKTAGMTPEEVKEALPRLIKELPSRDDTVSVRQRTLVDLLIKAGQTQNSKCSVGDFDKRDDLIKAYSMANPAILDYLHHCKAEQFSRCEGVFEEVVDLLDTEDLDTVTKLTHVFISMKKVDPDDGEEDQDTLEDSAFHVYNMQLSADDKIEGLKTYVNPQAGPLGEYLSRTNSRDRKRMIREAQTACKSIVDQTEPFVGLYEYAEHDEQLKEHMTDFVLDWMDKATICKLIKGDAKKIAEQIQNNLTSSA